MTNLLLPERIKYLCAAIHADNVEAGWWSDLETGQRKERNVGELLMLCVSEVAEAAESAELNLKDDKLPHRDMLEVELADMDIRIFDIAGGHKLDLAGAIEELDTMIDDRGRDRYGQQVCFNPNASLSEALMQLVRHLACAMEGHRKNKNHAVLPHRKAFEVGLALAVIDSQHIAEIASYNLDAAIQEKRQFNANRADHKIENRMKADGKKY